MLKVMLLATAIATVVWTIAPVTPAFADPVGEVLHGFVPHGHHRYQREVGRFHRSREPRRIMPAERYNHDYDHHEMNPYRHYDD